MLFVPPFFFNFQVFGGVNGFKTVCRKHTIKGGRPSTRTASGGTARYQEMAAFRMPFSSAGGFFLFFFFFFPLFKWMETVMVIEEIRDGIQVRLA